jgi:hypothetical protein
MRVRCVATMCMLVWAGSALGQIPTMGLVAWYPLDGDAQDLSGNGRNGTWMNVAATADRFGVQGKSADLNGLASYVDLGPVASFPLASFTISVWICPDSANEYSRIFRFGSDDTLSGNWNGFGLEYFHHDLSPAHQPYGMLYYGRVVPPNTYPAFSVSSQLTVPEGQWHHVTFSYDRVTRDLKIYIDGTLRGHHFGNTDAPFFDPASGRATIGRNNPGGLFFHGKTDAVRLYDRALADAEVLALFHEAPPTAYTIAPTGVAESNAVLQGTVNPNGLSTTYHFEYGLTTNYGLSTKLQNAGSGLSQSTVDDTVDNLSPGTLYHYRLVASNGAGTTLGTDISFTTDATQSLTAPLLVTPANGSKDQSTDPSLTWGTSVGATSYHLQVSATPSFTLRVVNDSSLTGTTRQVTGLANNTTYYWRVAARGAAGKSTFSSPYSFQTTASKTLNSVVATFPSNPGSSTDYRLVSFPGASGYVVGQLLPGAQTTDWRVFRDIGGSPPDHLTELGASAATTVGEGYWLLAKGAPGFSRSVTMPALDSTGATAITIRNGWNIIGNPLDQNVNWSAVKSANGLSTASIFSFQGAGGFQSETVLQPFGGYYFNNTTGTTTLKIPYPYAGGLTIASVTPPIAWRLRLAYNSDINRDVENYIGISPSSLEERDELDEQKPPAFMDQGVVCFMRPGWDSTDSRFMSDYRPAVGAGQVWQFQVINPRLSDGFLRIVGVEGVPQEYEVVLINLQNSIPYDVRKNAEYRFRSVSTATPFKLVVGGKAFVEEEVKKTLPATFRLEQNYPNPFNPTTSIAFGLPKESEVRLEVYSALGQRVAVLAEGRYGAGVHTVVWDTHGEGQAALPAGCISTG